MTRSLGAGSGRSRSNGLARLAGTWTPEELDRFEAAVTLADQTHCKTIQRVGSVLLTYPD